MPPTPEIEFGGTEELARAKIVAREKLLAMDVKEAQKLVDRTLYPQDWSCTPVTFTWCGSLALDIEINRSRNQERG
ncbi:MAG: hypothetical protein KME17_21845 [Cyanosarcina radialis HA8281-LM2]|jgi:hypothetical protein|nr:hypothetical protein [Cyanosarcina radialis HA8281-LM2]